jgi:hypothetical protein
MSFEIVRGMARRRSNLSRSVGNATNQRAACDQIPGNLPADPSGRARHKSCSSGKIQFQLLFPRGWHATL